MFYAWQVNELFLLVCGESEVRVGSLVTGRGAWCVSCLGFVLTGSDGLDGMSWKSVDVRGGYGRGRYGVVRLDVLWCRYREYHSGRMGIVQHQSEPTGWSRPETSSSSSLLTPLLPIDHPPIP